MKNKFTYFLILLFIGIFIAILYVIYIYFNTFSGPYSNNQAIWGVFGDYIGGTLNPILAFSSFIALLVTLHLQYNELQETRNIAADQQNHLIEQSKKNDLINVLMILEEQVMSKLSQDSKIQSFYSTPLCDFISFKGKGEHYDVLKDSNKKEKSIEDISYLIYQIHHYLSELSSLNNTTYTIEFYRIKYSTIVDLLVKLNYIEVSKVTLLK